MKLPKRLPHKERALTLVAGKIMEKIILVFIEKHLKDKAVISHSQHGFIRGKSCLTTQFAFVTT